MEKQLAHVLLVCFSSLAQADLASVTECVHKRYQALADYRGIVAAVIDSSESQILTFGLATRDQIFEIGSITKTFTATLLAQEIIAGKLRITDPIPT